MEDEMVEIENQNEEVDGTDVVDDECALTDPSTESYDTVALAALGLAAIAGGAIVVGVQKLGKPAVKRFKGWWKNRKVKRTGVVDVEYTSVEGENQPDSKEASDGK